MQDVVREALDPLPKFGTAVTLRFYAQLLPFSAARKVGGGHHTVKAHSQP
jgi:hypothetical protein